jgi:hypothetical protein
VIAACGRLQELSGNPRLTKLSKLAQGGLFESLELVAELLLGRALGAAEEQPVEAGEERSGVVHA